MSWVIINGLLFLLFMTVMRFVFFYRFHAPGAFLKDFARPFITGLNYDLRIVCGAVLFPFLVGSLKLKKNSTGRIYVINLLQLVVTAGLMGGLLFYMNKGHMQTGTLIFFGILFTAIIAWMLLSGNCNPFESTAAKYIIKGWFIFVSVVLVVFYGADLEHYDYLRQRLSAGVLDYGVDVSVSMRMIWQTYPVFSILLYMVACTGIFIFLMNYSYRKIAARKRVTGTPGKFVSGLIFILLCGAAIYGKFDQYPLRWSDAFDFRDDFKASLTLNPIQSFLSTIQYRHSGYDLALVKKFYPRMAAYLGVKDPDLTNLNYSREFIPQNGTPKRNVIIVICESFSMYKSSMSGNKLNTTPYFNEMCRSGVFFDHCFTPSYGTARGVWATITGIPDVSYPNTSSRNPLFVNQHSIMNDYREYSKYYFIGGSSSWANIRGLLTNNLSGLHLLEEQDFKAEKIDVWGISDKRLLLAANDTFAKQNNPFIAVIQTADNHRPYTIPEEDKHEFKLVSYSKDTLYKYGFATNGELNAFRYTDFTFKKFMEAAKKEPYFKNTLFVFVGDHGINGNADAEYPRIWEEADLTVHHVPLLFYGPDFLAPVTSSKICSQADVLPTASALAGIPYTNTTLGINLTDSLHKNTLLGNFTFVYDPTIRKTGIISDNFVFNRNLVNDKEDIFAFPGNPLPDTSQQREMRDLTTAWFQTAMYMLSHNQKDKVHQEPH